MGRTDPSAADERRQFIDAARATAAMDLYIVNGGRPPDSTVEKAIAGSDAAGLRERGPRPGARGARSAFDALLDQIVGFDDAGNLTATIQRERGGATPRRVRERGPVKIVPEHYQPGTLYEWTFYPAHDDRQDSSSSAYRAARKKLVATGTCLVCGVGKDTLNDPSKNPFQAKQMETHHRVIEWALGNAIDVDRFNARFVSRRHAMDPGDAKYADANDASKPRTFTQAEMLAWVDHDPDNLWVLCDVHHRAPFMGIHAITRPHWDPQDLLFPKFWNRKPPPDQDPSKKKPKTNPTP